MSHFPSWVSCLFGSTSCKFARSAVPIDVFREDCLLQPTPLVNPFRPDLPSLGCPTHIRSAPTQTKGQETPQHMVASRLIRFQAHPPPQRQTPYIKPYSRFIHRYPHMEGPRYSLSSGFRHLRHIRNRCTSALTRPDDPPTGNRAPRPKQRGLHPPQCCWKTKNSRK